ncbi:MAG: hypothetical protein EKK29_13815 [Hyphomicrobiales bacterium]|nr:MAG: hypothetical protein EKK29_13815 [Hyphomicrobiales bacterium]
MPKTPFDPLSAEDLEAIEDTIIEFSPDARVVCLAAVKARARDCALAIDFQKNFKDDPLAEILELEKAALAFIGAVNALGPQAHVYLSGSICGIRKPEGAPTFLEAGQAAADFLCSDTTQYAIKKLTDKRREKTKATPHLDELINGLRSHYLHAELTSETAPDEHRWWRFFHAITSRMECLDKALAGRMKGMGPTCANWRGKWRKKIESGSGKYPRKLRRHYS